MEARHPGTHGRNAVDAEQLRQAVRDFVLDNETEMRDLLRELLTSMPDLLELDGLTHSAKLERLLQRMVQAEIAASPVAARAASFPRQLGLFPPSSSEAPLAPVKAHASTRGYIEPPAIVLGEPLQNSIERDPHPLPTTEDREGYHADRHFDYWLSGLEDFLKVHAALERHGRAIAAPFSVLDFGCASGRVLRHFLCQLPGLDVWGADLNERHVEWLLAHFPPALKAFQCTTLPILPLPDSSFDLVTAFSVFTHIDEYELAWLLELRRILRPGGFFYVTVHSEDTWKLATPGVTLYEHLYQARDAIPDFKIHPELFQQPMPREKTVFRWNSAELNNTSVFLSKRHLREVWGRFFDVLEILPQASGYQDVVVLRKPG